jgi:uncharacterized protein YjbJ (UPF0337 family)
MDNARYSGILHEAKGALEQVAGALANQHNLHMQGRFDRAIGKVQIRSASIMGGMKDAVREHQSQR